MTSEEARFADLVSTMLEDLDEHDCDSTYAYRSDRIGPDLVAEMLTDLEQHDCESFADYRAQFDALVAESL